MSDPAAATAAPEPELTYVIYLGQRVSTKGDLAVALVAADFANDIPADQVESRASLFHFKKADVPRVVGAIYTVKATVEEGRVTRLVGLLKPSDHPDHSERWERADLVALCEAKHKAALVQQRVAKQQDAMAKDPVLAKVLAPLKHRWSQTDAVGRLALELVVLQELRRAR